MKNLSVATLAFCLSTLATPAAAQTLQWTEKGYVSINGGFQAGSHPLDTSATFTIYDENATVASTTKVKSGGVFDIGGAYRVWGRNLLAGVSYSLASAASDVAVIGSIPDPAFTDHPRAVAYTQPDAKHTESVVHLDAIYMIPVMNKMDVGVFFGPSIFMVKQDVVSAPTVTEPGPAVNTPLVEVKKTSAGINLGVDIQYVVYKKWAVGGLARYAWGSTTIPGATDKLTLGGFQIGAGVRMRF